VTNINMGKIDDTVLALLYLGLHDGCRAWKGFDWDAMHRLHEKGYISDPVGKAKSVVFTEVDCASLSGCFASCSPHRRLAKRAFRTRRSENSLRHADITARCSWG
jgi:hypothetical protein